MVDNHPAAKTLRVALATLGLASALTSLGCSSTVSCDDVCSCLGKSGDKTCVASCTESQAAAKQQAADAHCVSQYADLTQCESDNATCDDVKKVYTYPAGVCDSRLKTYDSCAHVSPEATGSTSSGASGSTSAGSTSTGN